MEWFNNNTDYKTNCLVERSDKTSYDKKLNEIKTWIGTPDLIFAYNLEEIDFKFHGWESIHRETHIINY